MEFIKLFISEYGTMIMYTVLTAIFGYLGVVAKRLVTKYLNDKTKRDIAKSCVQFVEQVYKDVHGEEKLNLALEAASEMLAEKGITCSELELRVLLEAAVASFNDAFNKTDSSSWEEEEVLLPNGEVLYGIEVEAEKLDSVLVEDIAQSEDTVTE